MKPVPPPDLFPSRLRNPHAPFAKGPFALRRLVATLWVLFLLSIGLASSAAEAGTVQHTAKAPVTQDPGCPELILNQGQQSWPEAKTLMPIVGWGCFVAKGDAVVNPYATSTPSQSPLLASSAPYRHAVAPWVLLTLALFTCVAYVLKIMYWRDVRPARLMTSIPGALFSGRLLRQWGLRPATAEQLREEGEDASVIRYRRLREHWRHGPERLKSWALFVAIVVASIATIIGIVLVEFQPSTFH